MEEIDLLMKLKQGLLLVNKDIRDSPLYFGNTNKNWKNSEKAQKYYLLRLNNNLFQNTNPQKKLGTGCKAVRSSAALIYNTIFDGNIVIDKKQYNSFSKDGEALYELPFAAIKDDKDSTHTAKLDAGLISSDGIDLLLFEAKCMEWFDKNPKSLKKAYLNKDRYLFEESASIFIPIFNELVLPNDIKEKGVLVRKAKTIRYDAIQMMIHCLGIFNWCLANKKASQKNPEKITLINLVWDYDGIKEYIEEENEGKTFESFANESLKTEFELLGINFSIKYVRYSEFLKQVDWSSDIEHRNYLKRYEV